MVAKTKEMPEPEQTDSWKERLAALEKANADMKSRLDAVEKENRDKQEIIANQQERIDKLIAKGAGWLVIAPNPLYDGEIFGIKFVNGQAWIAANRKVEHFAFEPMKDTQLEKYKPEEQARIREREKTPSSKRAVDAIASDYGFKVIFFDGKDQEAIQNVLDARAKERADVQAKLDEELAAPNVDALMRPHYMG